MGQKNRQKNLSCTHMPAIRRSRITRPISAARTRRVGLSTTPSDIVDLPPNIFVFFDARHPHDTPGRDRACDAYRENQMSTGAFRHFHQTYPGIPALIFYIRLMSYVYVHNLTFFCTFCNTCLMYFGFSLFRTKKAGENCALFSPAILLFIPLSP